MALLALIMTPSVIVAGTPRVFNELLETIAPYLTAELKENTSGN